MAIGGIVVALAVGLAPVGGGFQTAQTACEEPEAQIRAIHERARQAHLSGDAALMAQDWAGEVVSVSNADLTVQHADQMRQRFNAYFAQVDYAMWRDAGAPVIRISPDGTMGWMAVKIEARLHQKGRPETERAFDSSWIATYERQGCSWKMTGIASGVAAAEESPTPTQ